MSPGLIRHKSFPLLQAAFDQALKRQEKYDTPLESLSEAHRVAFLVRLFDGQILSNGFQFWITNGYVSRNEELLAVLDTIDARRCDYVKRLVRESDRIAALAEKMEEEDRPEEDFGELAFRCYKMGITYGLIRDEFIKDVEKHVERLTSASAQAKRAKRATR